MKKAFPVGLLLLLAACQKKDDPPVPPPTTDLGTGTVQFRYTPVVGDQPLVLGTKTYANAAGDSFNVVMHKYFVSNFSLIDSAGKETALPKAYFLVDADSLRTVSISGVSGGQYTKLSFLIGVDSARNVSGAQDGDLNPAGRARGMFWDWNTGYITAKMEGTSPQSTDPAGHSLVYHIGTYSGKFSALRRVTLDLPKTLTVQRGTNPTLQVQSDLKAWFNGTPPISFSQGSTVMEGNATSKKIADNYATAYKVVRIDP